MCQQPPLVVVFSLFSALIVRAANISWASPSAGDVYGPGDTIIARWESDTVVSSPSFRLCEANSSGVVSVNASCGASVSPSVHQSAGSYFISVSTPNVTKEIGLYLQMEDTFGKTIESPNFALSPTPVPLNATSSILNSPQLVPDLVPDLTANHVPPPTVAFAIPLSILAAILLASMVLCLHHRRKLNEERALDKLKLSTTKEKQNFSLMSSSASSRVPSVIYLSSSAGSDHLYASKDAHNDIYTPVYKLSSDSHSHPRRESTPRTSTRQAFPIPKTIVTAPTIHYARSSHPAPAGFNTSNSIPSSRSTKVPASLFKAHRSPVVHPPPGLERQRIRPRSMAEEEQEENASVNHSVISDYMAPSPVPPCLSPGMPAKPGKLYVRNGVDPLFDFDTPSPTNRPRYSDQAAYEAVDNVVRSKVMR